MKRRGLKGKGISLTEQLTSRKANILRKANELVVSKCIQSSWSHEGRILIKTLSNEIVVITNINQLSRYQLSRNLLSEIS